MTPEQHLSPARKLIIDEMTLPELKEELRNLQVRREILKLEHDSIVATIDYRRGYIQGRIQKLVNPNKDYA